MNPSAQRGHSVHPVCSTVSCSFSRCQQPIDNEQHLAERTGYKPRFHLCGPPGATAIKSAGRKPLIPSARKPHYRSNNRYVLARPPPVSSYPAPSSARNVPMGGLHSPGRRRNVRTRQITPILPPRPFQLLIHPSPRCLSLFFIPSSTLWAASRGSSEAGRCKQSGRDEKRRRRAQNSEAQCVI